MRSHLRLTGLALAGALAACSDSAGPGAGTQVTFHLVGSRSPAAVPGVALLGDTIGTATDTLVLDTVQLVLRDIRFQRINEDQCDGEMDQDLHAPVALHHDDGEDDGDDGHSDACESFNAGPFLLDVPLGPDIARAFSVAVDTGTFDRLRIKVHKPEDDDGDPKDIAFLAAHPEFQGVSIRVTGSFNGTPFGFTSDLDAEQRMDLVPPLVVADSVTNVDVTIKVDVRRWFVDGAGGLVDPASAAPGGPNDHLVRDNIENSFRAFRDDDHDGEDDDHDGTHD